MSAVFASYRQRFVDAVAAALGVPPSAIDARVKLAELERGDFSLREPTHAQRLAAELRVDGLELFAAGDFLNARVKTAELARAVIDDAHTQGDRFGHGDCGTGKTVIIDYSSPNIAKPIGFHHIRSTVIGAAIARLYRSQGWRVEGINYLGDWGKQFGLVAVGLQELGDLSRKSDVRYVLDIYVKASARAKQDPDFDGRARSFFRRMEDGDAAALELWRELRDVSVASFREIYGRLGIAFEHYEGESTYQGRMQPVIDEIAGTIGTEISDGALIVNRAPGATGPPVLLRKDDGTTLYATRDLTAAGDRYERFRFDRALYVIAADQDLHCRQFFDVLARLGKPWAKSLVHVSFGRVHGMSTRLGQITLLADVLDEAKARALEKVQANIASGRMQSDEPQRLAEQIGVGAIVFGDLKNRRQTDYRFDWEQVLSFEGHTGPYVQYAHARACNVLRKAGATTGSFDAARLVLAEERAVVRAIALLPVAMRSAVANDEPSEVTRQVLELAAAFSKWFTLGNQAPEHRILVEGDKALRATRIALTCAVQTALRVGLTLLGIAAPERM